MKGRNYSDFSNWSEILFGDSFIFFAFLIRYLIFNTEIVWKESFRKTTLRKLGVLFKIETKIIFNV